ncbi:MAG: D-alanyl-D-alanine carboxypeptidase family protein [Christensenellales bacterium]
MKKALTAFAVCLAIAYSLCFLTGASGPAYKCILGTPAAEPAQAGKTELLLIWDYDTGAQLIAKNEDLPFPPAGGAVLWMTAKIAAQRLGLKEMVEVSNTDELPNGSREIGLKAGDRLTVRDLLAAVLLYGAQDAASVLAKKAAGSLPAFVGLMNEEAKKLQMNHTVYTNPFGIPEAGQSTTAEDLLLLSRAVLDMPSLEEIISLGEYTPEGALPQMNGVIVNRCKMMLKSDAAYDERITGASLGSTAETGTIALFRAAYKETRVILVLKTGKPSDQVNAMAKELLNYAFMFKKVDLTPYIEQLAKETAIQTKGTKTESCGLLLENGGSLLFSAAPGFEKTFDPKALKLIVNGNTVAENVCLHGIAASAQVLYDGEKLADVLLTAEAIKTEDPLVKDVTQPVSPAEETPYVRETSLQPMDFMDRFGWVVYTAAAGALSLAAVLVGRVIRRKMQ